VYSLVAIATLAALIIVFAHHKHAGPLLWYLRATAPIRWLAWSMMLAALTCRGRQSGSAPPRPLSS